MIKLVATAASAIALMATLAVADEAKDPRVAEAQAIIKEFFGTLKGELEAGMKQGGPVNAITVCKGRAPAISEEMSAKHGWEVGRTSLKLRNSILNKPDAWEVSVLEQFEARKAKGEDVTKIDFAEVVATPDGKQAFRYMKAIPTQELCLNCHGAEIKPEVAAALDKFYPDDKARGFKEGDIRGAFTLSKPL